MATRSSVGLEQCWLQRSRKSDLLCVDVLVCSAGTQTCLYFPPGRLFMVNLIFNLIRDGGSRDQRGLEGKKKG